MGERRGWIPDNSTILQYGANEGYVKSDEGGSRIIKTKVAEHKAENLSGFAASSSNTGSPGEGWLEKNAKIAEGGNSFDGDVRD